jgi:putative transposase
MSSALLAALHRHASEWTQMGYQKLHGLVCADGFVINHKRFFRIYKEEGLRIPRRRRRRKFCGPRHRLELPARINQRRSVDFVSDQLALGRRFRTLNIVDDKSRECLSIEVGTSLTGTQVVRVLDRLVQLRSRPKVIVMDNGPEFISGAMADWSMKMGVRLHFIRPGKPTENAFALSFNAVFRRECLNENWFLEWPTPGKLSRRGATATTIEGHTARLEISHQRSIHDGRNSPSNWLSDGGQTTSFLV